MIRFLSFFCFLFWTHATYGEVYHDLRQYDRCSTNNACVYFLLAGNAKSGICGPIDVACNQLVPCKNSNYTCSMPDHVCIYHPRCNFLPVCYPTRLSDEKRCRSTEDQNGFVHSQHTCQYPTHIVPDYPTLFWREKLRTNGSNPYAGTENYLVFRNVKDYGARGDGISDDTEAIQSAISSGNRCSAVSACEGSTSEPGLVYFPKGTYLISRTIQIDYYTQLIGDPIGKSLPTIKGSSEFKGSYVFDANPYNSHGDKVWESTDNFFREIRNLRLDMTSMIPTLHIAGIHWPVAQATALQNLIIEMSNETTTQQRGLIIEDGSGGFMSDITMIGGMVGAMIGNQQFTSRNMTFIGCQTAIRQTWNWSWLYKSLSIINCNIGIDMAVPQGNSESVGGITVLDSYFYNTSVGILTSANSQSMPPSAGQILLDNVHFEQTSIGVQSTSGHIILEGNQLISSWGQGHVYNPSSNNYTYIQGLLPPPVKADVLLDGSKFLEHSRPEYLEYSVDQFVTVKSLGAKGDGVTDDTAIIQKIIDTYAATKIIFFDAGFYIHTSTVLIPSNAVIVGEVESVIMARGSFFGDAQNPKAVWSIGQPGDTGNVQIVDMLFSQQGPVQGAILLQWNLQASCPGKSGLWSTNFRIGGTKGTNQSPSNCLQLTHAVDRPECQGAFLNMHITPYGSLYMENVWLWTADHYLDYPDHFQIDVFNARSFLIESQGPLWMYGTASEHSVLYQYHFVNAKNIFCGQLQTETAYFQTNPPAPTPFKSLPTWSDPIFDACPTNDSFCAKGWGVDIINGTNIYIYNAGIYSFFQEWSTTCIGTPHNRYCQDAIFRIRGSTDQVYVWNLQTVGVENMVEVDDAAKVKSKDNVSVFTDSILGYLPKV